jgi:hypothetical protein
MSHEDNVEMLARLAATWQLHHDQTKCGLVQCTGNTEALRIMQARFGRAATEVILSAVCLLAAADQGSAAQERLIADLRRQLEVQRGLTADAAAQTMRMDASLVAAYGTIEGLEERLATFLPPVAGHG